MGFLRKKPQSRPADPSLPEVSQALPLVPYRVVHCDIPFYADSQCRKEVLDARLCILDPLDARDSLVEYDYAPTIKRYRKGQLVTWALDKTRFWEEAWFRHPETSEIIRAWTMQVHFVGKVVSEEAVDTRRRQLEEIEQRRHEHRAQEAGKKLEPPATPGTQRQA